MARQGLRVLAGRDTNFIGDRRFLLTCSPYSRNDENYFEVGVKNISDEYLGFDEPHPDEYIGFDNAHADEYLGLENDIHTAEYLRTTPDSSRYLETDGLTRGVMGSAAVRREGSPFVGVGPDEYVLLGGPHSDEYMLLNDNDNTSKASGSIVYLQTNDIVKRSNKEDADAEQRWRHSWHSSNKNEYVSFDEGSDVSSMLVRSSTNDTKQRNKRRPMPRSSDVTQQKKATDRAHSVPGQARADLTSRPVPAIDTPHPPYYHGAISDMEANDRLWQAGMHEGLFLVREVQQNTKYMLCVVRDDKIERYSIDRDESLGIHFVLNSNIRLWLTCCVDEVIAEILTCQELRSAMNGDSSQMLMIALGVDGRRRYLTGIFDGAGVPDPAANETPNGKVTALRKLHAFRSK